MNPRTNEDRAAFAEDALYHYNQVRDGGDYGELRGTWETDIVDLMADLLHLASQKGIDPYYVINVAQTHYEEEL